MGAREEIVLRALKPGRVIVLEGIEGKFFQALRGIEDRLRGEAIGKVLNQLEDKEDPGYTRLLGFWDTLRGAPLYARTQAMAEEIERDTRLYGVVERAMREAFKRWDQEMDNPQRSYGTREFK
ncbi:MAG: hypothetical protein Q7S65_00830 [Nanoarchaeota archaeon]|nr:hypothetical protein [Nanoarchaeota archaeon]